MTFEEYVPLAQRTSDDVHDKLMAGTLGLIGESGEVVDMIKKYLIQSGDAPVMDREMLVKEIGDVCWYVAEFTAGVIANGGVEMVEKDFRWEEVERALTTDDKTVLLFEGLPTSCPTVDTLPEGKIRGTALWANFSAHVWRVCMYLARDIMWMTDTDSDAPGGYDVFETDTVAYTVLMHLRALLYLFQAGTLEETLVKNVEKLRKRYPDGFSAERSMHRERDDV